MLIDVLIYMIVRETETFPRVQETNGSQYKTNWNNIFLTLTNTDEEGTQANQCKIERQTGKPTLVDKKGWRGGKQLSG